MNELTISESQELHELETIIHHNLANFIACGQALLIIRDRKLYRADFSTFENYCRDRWDMGRHYANRLIASAEVAANLAPMGTTIENERQARELAKHNQELQKTVYEIARATAPQREGQPVITAEHLREVGNLVVRLISEGGLEALITEDVYERMMRQQQHIRDKLAAKTKKATTPGEVRTLPAGQVLITVIRDLIRGIDLTNVDRGTKLHPALNGPYALARGILGEPTGEMTLLVDTEEHLDDCYGCNLTQVQTREAVLTVFDSRVTSVRLLLCQDCLKRYQSVVTKITGEVVIV